MGSSHDADIVWGIIVADVEEEQPDPYGEDWKDLPDFLDFTFSGDSGEGWGGMALFLKGTRAYAWEGGIKKVDLSLLIDAVDQFSETDRFEEAVAWCEKHGLEWCEATWLLIASRG
jgi:hypothetical protein